MKERKSVLWNEVIEELGSLSLEDDIGKPVDTLRAKLLEVIDGLPYTFRFIERTTIQELTWAQEFTMSGLEQRTNRLRFSITKIIGEPKTSLRIFIQGVDDLDKRDIHFVDVEVSPFNDLDLEKNYIEQLKTRKE